MPHRLVLPTLLLLLLAPLLLAPLLPSAAASTPDTRRWERENRARAASSAREFAEWAGERLSVPLDVDVYLVGFDGDGGYGHVADAVELAKLLAGAGRPDACPRSLDTGEEVGVCFRLDYRVYGASDLGDEVS